MITTARHRTWAEREGAPLPLGVTWLPDEQSYNFALYSKHAERVVLLAFGEADVTRPVFTLELDYLRHKSGRIWHCRVPKVDLLNARYYAYSVDGPAPAGVFAWHTFDASKVLLDPYADAVHFPPAFDREAAIAWGGNAGRAPLGAIPDAASRDEDTAEGRVDRPRVTPHETDAVIYELHVRNFTQSATSGVPAEKRGTFAGIIEKIPYLVGLGVTIVELMPVFQYDPAGSDRWGYMPLSFFALHRAYASDKTAEGAEREFREMVDALHRAGIEVLLDVVYNHTCEAGGGGPVYSYKGIDNSTYYLMVEDAAEPYANFAGTGNTLNCVNHAVRKMILDSMRRWVRRGVDGFRFDLASIYARGADGVIRSDEPPIIGEINGDPEFAGVRLIAEPWDAGAYQLGRRFPGLSWHQWNGAFRDDVRRFVRGDPGLVPTVMRRLYGSDDLFPDDRINAYRPSQSVNYIASHDGPTLYDLVSYTRKQNWTNGHGNTDGPAESFSWNCGWEGDVDVPDDVRRLRLKQAKNCMALVLLANGTPMLRAGDEMLQTQAGNDNPYNQDNDTTWLDWARGDAANEMRRFTSIAIAFRKMHPSLGRSRFWRDDVRWYGVGPRVDLSPESRSFAYCIRGTDEGDADIYVMINASLDPLVFEVQEGDAADWRRVIDTSRTSPDDARAPGDEEPLASMRYIVDAHTVVVLVRIAGS